MTLPPALRTAWARGRLPSESNLGGLRAFVCGQPDWERNLEAARLFGAELERAVNEAEKKPQDETSAALNDGLTPIQAKDAGEKIPQV